MVNHATVEMSFTLINTQILDCLSISTGPNESDLQAKKITYLNWDWILSEFPHTP